MESYKEKYEQALTIAKETYNTQPMYREWLEKMFPELKESKEEKIRKALVKLVQHMENDELCCNYRHSKNDFLSWLEKQEHTDSIIEKAKTEKQRIIITETDGNANIDWDTRSLEDARRLLECGLQYINAELERQSEQKKTICDKCKIEQPSHSCQDITALGRCAVEHEQKPDADFPDLRTWKYIVDTVWTEKEGIGQYLDSLFTEEVAKKLQKRFGNIKQKLTQEIEPFEAEHGKYYYCIKDYFCGGRKQASKGDVIQALRGLPIMGLKDASEYFLPVNFIKCNSTWSREDEQNLNAALGYIRDEYLSRWLKDAIYNKYEKPAEWSEEDERLIEEATEYLRKYASKVQGGNSKVYVLSLADRIESLRPQNRWKPSDEQMEVLLSEVTAWSKGCPIQKVLESLYNDLKKLKEE